MARAFIRPLARKKPRCSSLCVACLLYTGGIPYAFWAPPSSGDASAVADRSADHAPPLADNLLDSRELLAFVKGCFARPPSVPTLFHSFSSRPAAHANACARAHSHVAYNCTACQRLHVPLIFVTANDALRHGDAGLRAPRCSLGALKHLPARLAVQGRRSKLRIALYILIGARAPERT